MAARSGDLAEFWQCADKESQAAEGGRRELELESANSMKLPVFALALLVAAVGLTAAAAESPQEPAPVAVIEIRFEHHRFSPEKVEVPAGVPLALRVINASNERIEFESFKLNREKVVAPNATLVVHLPALRPGRYDFFDDFHSDVPEGTIVAH